MKPTKNIIALATLAAIVAVGAPASPISAGDDDHDHGEKKKCTAEATACIREMNDSLSDRGWIGIEWDDEAEHPVLTQVVSNSPAEAAGLEKGDRLIAFNDVSTNAGDEAVWAEAKKVLVPGNTITLTIVREGVTKKVDVELVSIPRHVIAQWVGNHVLEHHMGGSQEAEAPKP